MSSKPLFYFAIEFITLVTNIFIIFETSFVEYKC